MATNKKTSKKTSAPAKATVSTLGGIKTMKVVDFDKKYRPASMADFKHDGKYFTRGGRAENDQVYPEPVVASGNLAQDAARFQAGVNSGTYFVEGSQAKAKAVPIRKIPTGTFAPENPVKAQERKVKELAAASKKASPAKSAPAKKTTASAKKASGKKATSKKK